MKTARYQKPYMMTQFATFQEGELLKKAFDFFLTKDKKASLMTGLENIRRLDLTVWLVEPKKEEWDEEGTIDIDDWHGCIQRDSDDPRRFSIWLHPKYSSYKELLGTFLHEMVHIRQWIYPEHTGRVRTDEQCEDEADYVAEQLLEEMWKEGLI